MVFAACGSHGRKASEPSSASSSTEDADLVAADFPNVNTMTAIDDHFVTNVRGHLDQALAIARSTDGGRYPVGTIIQLVPQEAMVKRAAGFSPSTNDWEFFSLEVSPTGTKILSRGGAEVLNRFGGSCSGCHSGASARVRLRVRTGPRLRARFRSVVTSSRRCRRRIPVPVDRRAWWPPTLPTR